MFAACSRPEIRSLARAGDECFVPAGTVLCRSGRIGYWLFVVMSGAVRLVDEGGSVVATLRTGSHFGEVAIIGFGPQPLTAEVAEDATVFVLGRRSVLDLVHSMPGFRDGLFPGVAASSFGGFVRSLRDDGTAAWRALPRSSVAELLSGDRVEQLPPTLVAVPSRSSGAGAGGVFAGVLQPRAGSALGVGLGSGRPVAVPLDRRVVAALVGGVAAAVVTFASLFHPDVVVVRPSAAIDITDDVRIAPGTASGLRPPRGRYVVTAVDIEETNLVGLGLARLRGEDVLPRAHEEVGADEAAAGRASYRSSQQVAVSLIARRAGLDPSAVKLRDRGLVGPSAGLAYALVLADMADVVAVPPGRVVAATGELNGDGRLRPVAFVGQKHAVARRSGATVFLVPSRAVGGAVEPGAVAVSTLDEALAAVGAG